LNRQRIENLQAMRVPAGADGSFSFLYDLIKQKGQSCLNQRLIHFIADHQH